MSYLPSYLHDVFISYTHVDDKPLPGADKGWVTTLVQNLKVLLDQKLGRKDAFDLWMDYRLSPSRPLSPEILDAVKHSATLVVILSPTYLKSPWCRREREGFLQMVAQRIKEIGRAHV